MHTARAAGSNILGDFAFVVREHQVHAAAVDVKFVAEVFLAHHGTLQMPTGEAFTPRGGPFHNMLGFCLFPKGEVIGSLLIRLTVQ